MRKKKILMIWSRIRIKVSGKLLFFNSSLWNEHGLWIKTSKLIHIEAKANVKSIRIMFFTNPINLLFNPPVTWASIKETRKLYVLCVSIELQKNFYLPYFDGHCRLKRNKMRFSQKWKKKLSNEFRYRSKCAQNDFDVNRINWICKKASIFR